MDAVADRHVADDAARDVAENRLDIGPLAEADRGGALAIGNPCRSVDDNAKHGGQRSRVMCIQERRTGIEAVQADHAGIEREFLVNRLVPEPGAADCGTRGPDDLDRAGGFIDAARTHRGHPPLKGQIDDFFRHVGLRSALAGVLRWFAGLAVERSGVLALNLPAAADLSGIRIEDQVHRIGQEGKLLPFFQHLARIIAAFGDLLGDGGEPSAGFQQVGRGILQRVDRVKFWRGPLDGDISGRD